MCQLPVKKYRIHCSKNVNIKFIICYGKQSHASFAQCNAILDRKISDLPNHKTYYSKHMCVVHSQHGVLCLIGFEQIQ